LWQASSPLELDQIGAVLTRLRTGDANVHVANIVVAPDIPGPDPSVWHSIGKEAGELRMIFLSRIVPMKNLDWALRLLKAVPGRVSLDVYGPIEDRAYWKRCETAVRSLPANIGFAYNGELPHDRVSGVLSDYHVLFLPTLGENYGHVIHEALSVGRPVIISDRTPWTGLADTGVGWDLPLEDPDAWLRAVRVLTDCGQPEFDLFSSHAAEYARGVVRRGQSAEEHIELFNAAIKAPHS
jgi:glycosyltransferase involved in cell wall biosynthesis